MLETTGTRQEMEREEEKYLNDLMDLPQEYTKAPETSTPKRKQTAVGDVNTSNQGLPQPQKKKRVKKIDHKVEQLWIL